MPTQRYSLLITDAQTFESARPGQLVFENDESNEVIGFISARKKETIEIILFEPRELDGPVYMHLDEELDWMPILDKICNEDVEMAEFWRKLAWEE